MLLSLSSSSLLYAACVALFHAHPKRSQLAFVRASERAGNWLRLAAYLLMAITLWLCASHVGWEYAIPIVIGVVGGAGILSLLASVYWPKIHLPSGIGLLVLGAVTGAASLIAP
ncbi:MAG: DUF3325 family protein [Pseudomonadota bacterium]